jgi:hypothetical protein
MQTRSLFAQRSEFLQIETNERFQRIVYFYSSVGGGGVSASDGEYFSSPPAFLVQRQIKIHSPVAGKSLSRRHSDDFSPFSQLRLLLR